MIKLKDIYLFQWLNKQFLDLIVDNSRRVNVNTGEYVVKQWDKSNNEAYIILEWEVIVEINWKIVNTISEWNIFWEIALITDESRTASIKASKDLILLKINKELLHNIIKNFTNWKEIQKIIFERIQENIKN
jgi:CRP-like cAMP-binding protein